MHSEVEPAIPQYEPFGCVEVREERPMDARERWRQTFLPALERLLDADLPTIGQVDFGVIAFGPEETNLPCPCQEHVLPRVERDTKIAGSQPLAAIVNPGQSAVQVLAKDWFQQVVERLDGEGPDRVVVMGSDEDNRRAQLCPLEDVESALLHEVNVQEEHVRKVSECGDRRLYGVRFSYISNVGTLLQQGAERHPGKRLVIDEQRGESPGCALRAMHSSRVDQPDRCG